MARRVGVAVWRRITERPDAALATLLGVLAFLPMVLTSRGQVSADTKTYLTVNPGDLLSGARFMWDPSVGAGTVPHQNIGYLFPLGPYYWLAEAAHVPDWLAQRLLWGLLVFLASYGTLRLLRWLGWSAAASLVAAVSYGFSPYLLSYLARLSAILFPWAALPWMVLLAARAARERSWFRAAQFAAVVALVGSVNATSLVFAGLGPVLWLAADAASGRVAAKSVVAAAGRIGVLCVAVSAWWISGLRVQGTYGLPILDYTESYQTVASSSTAPEVLRGMGYWFFYGGDRLDSWVGPSLRYFNNPAVMFISFGLAGAALLGLVTRFRGRASMLALFLVGLVLSVGAAPLGNSTWYGAMFERFATDSTAGAALRSTPRAAPLVLLALACGLGAGTDAARTWLTSRPSGIMRRSSPLVPALGVVLVLVNLLPWFIGDAASSSLLRPETLPADTTLLAGYLNQDDQPTDHDGRIYAIPGADFADYRWGGTVDPVLPGLTDRSVLYRELVPQGGAGTADLLNAFERRLSEGWFEPASLPVVARLFDVDTVVVRNDLQHERYRLARPGPLWTDVVSVLGTPEYAGAETTDQTEITLVDEVTLARTGAQQYPINAAFEVGTSHGPSLVDATASTVLAGNGDGVVDAAAAGLLDSEHPLFYAALLQGQAPAASTDTHWIVTDTNRKQGRRWSTIGSNLGALESTGPLYLDDDPNDNRLHLFSDELSTDEQTVAVHLGAVADIAASSYGSRIVYTAEDAPHFALDGDVFTAWRAGIAEPTTSLRWTAEFAQPEDLRAVTLLQPQVGANNRFVTKVKITIDNGSATFALGDDSRAGLGQTVDLAAAGVGGPTESVAIEILADNVGSLSSYAGQPGVGFAEITPIRVDGSPIVDDQTVRLPLARSLGIADTDSLSYVFTRQRINPATPNRQAPEPSMDRQFDTGAERAFVFSAQARLASTATDQTIAEVMNRSGEESGLTALASTRLPGSVASRGSAAIDGDLTTAWQTPFDGSVGATLTLQRPVSTEVTSLTVTWRSDTEHSAPTQLSVTDGPTVFSVDLAAVPAVPAGAAGANLVTATVPVSPFVASTTVITVDATSGDTVPEYYSGAQRLLPIAIAEIGFDVDPAASTTSATTETAALVDSECRSDLLLLDGVPLPVSITGHADGVLDVVSCDSRITLDAGTHRIVAADGRSTGIDLDRIVLTDQGADAVTEPHTAPVELTVVSESATALTATAPATSAPAWLVFPQSLNLGWAATVDGVDLGEPQLINGYANAWLLPAGGDGRTIELRWTPQRSIDIAMGLSVLAGLLVVVLIGLGVVRQRRTATTSSNEVSPDPSGTPIPVNNVAASGVLVVGFLVVGGPFAAAASAAISVLALRRSSVGFSRLVAVAVTCIGWALVSGSIIALEWRYDYANGPDWPLRFAWASPVTWAVVGAIGTQVVHAVLAGRSTNMVAGADPTAG